tara:strand:- start:107 stop:559 length:453 start_codon:yes stop_codon:yes gene_type:complete
LYKFFKRNNKEIFRFLVSGFIATSFNFISYKAIYLIFKNILFASISGYCTGILVSFVLAKAWVYNNRSNQPLLKSFSLFCFIYFLGGIEMSLVILFLDRLIENYNIAWVFGAVVGSLNNFLGSKYFLFKEIIILKSDYLKNNFLLQILII